MLILAQTDTMREVDVDAHVNAAVGIISGGTQGIPRRVRAITANAPMMTVRAGQHAARTVNRSQPRHHSEIIRASGKWRCTEVEDGAEYNLTPFSKISAIPKVSTSCA
jgi:hypothetical protein